MNQLSNRCSVNFTPIFPYEYNESVDSELIQFNLDDIPNTCWENLDILSLKRDLMFEPTPILPFKKSEQKIQGDETEEEFIVLCQKHNLNFQKSTFQEDYYDHIDFKISTSDNYEILIDVKSMKSVRRNGPKQNKYMFVELNLEGWLYGGKSNYIAIQFNKMVFLIFDKFKLQQYVDKTVYRNLPVVAWPEQSLNRVYIRKSRHQGKHVSILSLISTLDAFSFAGVGKLC